MGMKPWQGRAQEKYKNKNKEFNFEQHMVWIPKAKLNELISIAKAWRDEYKKSAETISQTETYQSPFQ